ncbi:MULTISPECIES: SAF domain-containing protein [Prauserella salsuginis group]|uniref:SAF domain-containing protein n=1 Tax=Prauserella salsuginis TaxID=387889 RepID=A0ABW6G8H7_9PSEU|nr:MULTISPECIES: SAF domain-containing protein [Prauserella salsuginis group]MCR3722632.1 Flp pilus assembly protein CpaB [Prauserella flava]MCR3737074.1 Flp pilus assembly protein CpaB [Prauserella salsuginis]
MAVPFARRTAQLTTALRARPVPVLRRVLAVALLLLAVLIAASPATAGDDETQTRPTLVFARDVPLGSTLRAGDVRVSALPVDLRPSGALRKPDEIIGQHLVGVAREGEPVTDARLLDRAPTPAGTVTVPVRLDDPDVAPLLHSGSHVDIVVPGTGTADRPAKQVLASEVPVLSVLMPGSPDRAAPGSSDEGPLVLVAARPEPATRLAAVAADQPVTVTLR